MMYIKKIYSLAVPPSPHLAKSSVCMSIPLSVTKTSRFLQISHSKIHSCVAIFSGIHAEKYQAKVVVN